MAVVVVANFKVVTFLTTLGTVLFFSDDNLFTCDEVNEVVKLRG